MPAADYSRRRSLQRGGGGFGETDPLRQEAEGQRLMRQYFGTPVGEAEAQSVADDTRKRALSQLADPTLNLTKSEREQLYHIAETGTPPEDVHPDGIMGVVSRVASTPVGRGVIGLLEFLEQGQDVIQLGVADLADAISGGPDRVHTSFSDYWAAFTGDREGVMERTGVDLKASALSSTLAAAGVEDTWGTEDDDGWLEKLPRLIVDIGSDVITDPLTLLGGAGLVRSVGHGALRGATRKLAQETAEKLVRTGGKLLQLSDDVAKVSAKAPVRIGFRDDFIQRLIRNPKATRLSKEAEAELDKLLARGTPIEEVLRGKGLNANEMRRAIVQVQSARSGLWNQSRDVLEEAAQTVATRSKLAEEYLQLTGKTLETSASRSAAQLRRASKIDEAVRNNLADQLDALADAERSLRSRMTDILEGAATTSDDLARVTGADTLEELVKNFDELTAAKSADMKTLDWLGGMDAAADGMFDEFAEAIARKDLSVLPQEIVDEAPNVLSGGLLISNPITQRVYAQVPGTVGLISRHTAALRRARQNWLHSGRVREAAYNWYRDARTALSVNYKVADQIRHGVKPSDAMRYLEIIKNHPMQAWLNRLTPHLQAGQRRLRDALGSDSNAQVAMRDVTRVVGTGFDVDGRGIRSFAERLEGLKVSNGGRWNDDEVAAIGEAAMALRREYDDLRRELKARFPDADFYENYSFHTFSEDMSALLTKMAQRGTPLTKEVDDSIGGQLLAEVLESAQNIPSSIPIFGGMPVLGKRQVGVGVVTAVPTARLRALLDDIIEGADEAVLDQRVLDLRQSLEGGFLDVVTMNDLIEEPLQKMAERLKVKLPRNTRVWEENPFTALSRYAEAVTQGIRLHDFREYAIKTGAIRQGEKYVSAKQLQAAVQGQLGDEVARIQMRIQREADKVAEVVTDLGTRTVERRVGRGRYSFKIEAHPSVLAHPSIQRTLERAERTLSAMNNKAREIEAAEAAVAASLRRAGFDEDLAARIAKSRSTERLRAVKSVLDTISNAEEHRWEALATEAVSILDSADAEAVLRTVATRRQAGSSLLVDLETRVAELRKPLSTQLSPAQLTEATRYLEAVTDGVYEGYLSQRLTALARNSLRGARKLDQAAVDAAAISRLDNLVRRAGIKRRHTRAMTTLEEALAAYSNNDRRALARELSRHGRSRFSGELLGDSLATIGVKYARALKEDILARYNFTDRQLRNIVDLAAETFDDDFFHHSAVKRAIGGDKQLEKLVTVRKRQAAQELLAADLDRQVIRLGGRQFSADKVRRVAQRLRRGNLDIYDHENQAVLEGWLRDLGYTGRFYWGENGVRIVQNAEEIIDLPRYRLLREQLQQAEGLDSILTAAARGDLKRAETLRIKHADSLQGAGVLRQVDDYLREQRLLHGAGNDLDKLIEAHSSFVRRHNSTLDRGIENVHRDVTRKLERFRDDMLAQLDPNDVPARQAIETISETMQKITDHFAKGARATDELIPIDDPEALKLIEWSKELRQALGQAGASRKAIEAATPQIRQMGIADTEGFRTIRSLGIDGPDLNVELIDTNLAAFYRNIVYNSTAAARPEAIAALSASLRTFLNIWKAQATVWRGTFHLRNLISGVWNSLIVGAGPKSYARYGAPALAFRKGLREGLSPTEAAVKATKDKRIRSALLVANDQGIFATSFVATEHSGFRSLSATNRDLFDPRHEKFILSQIGGRAMEGVEDVHRFTVFARHYNPDKPVTATLARDLVHAVHFDYSDPTQTVSRIKMLAPFFVWTKNNIPLQFQAVLEQPRLLQAYNRFLNTTERTLSSDSEASYDQFAKPKHLPYFHAETDIILNEGTPYWARVIIAPDNPVNDIMELQPLSLEGWASLFDSSISPLYTMFQTYLAQEDFGKVTSYGGVRMGRHTRGIIETAFPAVREYASMLGLEMDPYRNARQGGIGPGDRIHERAARQTLSRIGAATVGTRFQVPTDTYSQAFEADELVNRIRREAMLRAGRQMRQ